MAQLSLDLPCLSEDLDSGVLNCSPNNSRDSLSPWCSFWVKIQRHYTSATLSLSIHPSRHKWVDSLSWLLWDLLHQLWNCRFWCMYWLHHTCINMNTHTCMQAEQLAYKLQLYLFGILFGGGGGGGGEFSFPKIFLFSLNLFPFILREYTFWRHARVLGMKCYICHGWECVSVKGIQAPLWLWPFQQSVAWI